MNDQEINIAIAEACGWKKIFHEDELADEQVWYLGERKDLNHARCCGSHNYVQLPGYTTDLDAMHEAERVLLVSQVTEEGWENRLRYEKHIENLIASPWIWHATARQRAEAFLRTLGKWKDES
jgi:hypothetical protein